MEFCLCNSPRPCQNRSMSDAVPDWDLLRFRHCSHQGCGAIFVICVSCDRSQRYCSTACREAQRRVQRRAANRRYQESERGRAAHQQCQQRYRERQRVPVTDQAGVLIVSPPAPVVKPPISTCVLCKRRGLWFDISPRIPGEWRRRRRSKQRRAATRRGDDQKSTFLHDR